MSLRRLPGALRAPYPQATLKEPSLELPVSVKVEVSFHQGALDLCPGDPPYIQSRIGEYVVIHSLR
jgi:hypothetical protein